MFKLRLLLPLDGETVSHDALFDTLHDWLDVKVAEVEPPAAAKLYIVGDTLSVTFGTLPSWVTLIVLDIPPPETVTIALR
jgi:hypothetical protein